MNRRNFVRLAVAAALAPIAFVRKPEPYLGYDLLTVDAFGPVVTPATYTWWRNRDDSRIDIANDPALIAEMERLYMECLNSPAPDCLIVWRT